MSKNNTKTPINKISNSSRVAQVGKSDQKTRIASKTSTTKGSTTNTPSKNVLISKNKDLNKNEDKSVVPEKSSILRTLKSNVTTKQLLSNKSSPSSVSSVSKTKPKLISTKIRTDLQTSRHEPLKAKRDTATLNKIKNLNVPSTSKPNLVKDTYHNVTIASPPPLRRSQNSVEFQSLSSEPDDLNDNYNSDVIPKIQERRRTITLEPDEVVVLKKENNEPQQNLDEYFGNAVKKKTDLMGEEITENKIKRKPKEPVAFEINFEDEKNKSQSNKITVTNDKTKLENKNDTNNTEKDECICSYEYDDDDFESYESDFETGSSSAEAEEESDESLNEPSRHNAKSDDHSTNSNLQNEEEEPKNQNDNIVDDDDNGDDDEEDSEETQPPITVIHRREKETERKLDSGNYDLKSSNYNNKSLETQMIHQQQQQQHHQQQSDSLDTTTNNSDHLDSGLGTISNNFKSFTYWSKDENSILGSIFPVSNESKRGRELMKKIKLDEITYQLFELKPMNYEYYMKIYGNLNTLQSSTQTNENILTTECQTDECQYRSMWTQHPPHFDYKSNISRNTTTNFMYCGEEEFQLQRNLEIESKDNIRIAITALQKFKKNEMKGGSNFLELQKQNIDFEKLNQFLNRVKVTVLEVLNRNSKSSENSEIIKSNLSNGHRKLNANFLNALKVVKIFSKVKYNFILTIHESTEAIYKNEFQNLIVVWSTSDLMNPIRLLSSWSQVSKVDICTESPDIIVSGLRDGGVAMWDLRETYSYCSKLDGYLNHFAASQSIVPSFGNDKETETNFSIDLGSVVDIKSFKAEIGAYALKAYKQIQFVSLNDTGILTIWSLIEIGKQDFNPRTPQNSRKKNNIKIEFSSPWARVKLVQSAICDLRIYLETRKIKIQSKFEQTILYFENDIFDNETLKELQKTNENYDNMAAGKELQGLRFTTLDASSNMIYIGTNRNFILACSKTLKPERFRKIHINDSLFMFPTAIRLHPNNEFLLVGLSNGSVVAINCNQNKPIPIDSTEFDNNEDTMSLKSNSESIDMIEMKKLQSSCAIQNMIRNERKIFEEFEQRNHHYFTTDTEFRPRTAIPEFEDLDNENGNPWKQYKIFDQQILLNGSILRKNLIECIEISLDGRKMYCLSDGDIKIYDFLKGAEINSSKDEQIKGICLTKAASDIGHYMILLKLNNIVEIHAPKN